MARLDPEGTTKRDSCNVCCNPTELSRGTDMYRSAVLQILCAILDKLEEIREELEPS